jgi:hypothetical protein
MIHNIILLYGFFQHTELIGRLGVLEYVLNTPSHHRVHHACNEKYLDKNFGGALIIWDRLFGTFQVEEEKPVFGLTKPVKSYNPFKIVFHEWILLTKDTFRSRSWKEALSYIFSGPGWSPETANKKSFQEPVKMKKQNCKKCDQCSLNCVARLNSVQRSVAV